MYKHVATNEEDEQITFEKIQSATERRPKRKPTRKTSYEASADVQRWLREQGSEEDIVKPPFQPSFLAGQRDAPWILSSLAHFYEQDLITDVLHVVRSGKEATVYCCLAHPSTGMDYLAAKVYRPRMFRSLKNDAAYRTGREQRDVDGRVVHGNRAQHGKLNERTRAARITSWIEYEYQTQALLHDAGVTVPKPLAQMGNAVLMEYIGELGEAAPLLHEVELSPAEAQALFESTVENMALALAHNRVHGDLSEYNILYWKGKTVLIDFAQAVNPRQNADVFALFRRDVERVCAFFALHSVTTDAYTLATTLWEEQIGHIPGL